MYTHRDENPSVRKIVSEMLGFPASQTRPAKHTQSLKPSGQPGGMHSNDPDFDDKGNDRSRRQRKKAQASPAVNEFDNEARVLPNGTTRITESAGKKGRVEPDDDGPTRRWKAFDRKGNRIPGLWEDRARAQAEVDADAERGRRRDELHSLGTMSLEARIKRLQDRARKSD